MNLYTLKARELPDFEEYTMVEKYVHDFSADTVERVMDDAA